MKFSQSKPSLSLLSTHAYHFFQSLIYDLCAYSFMLSGPLCEILPIFKPVPLSESKPHIFDEEGKQKRNKTEVLKFLLCQALLGGRLMKLHHNVFNVYNKIYRINKEDTQMANGHMTRYSTSFFPLFLIF